MTDFRFPNGIVFVLIVGGVAFHGSASAGGSLALLAGVGRIISTGTAVSRNPTTFSAAVLEGLTLVALLLGFVILADALSRTIGALQEQALRDPLTGALNTRGFMELGERERLRVIREGLPLTVAYFDIDGLKEYNDRKGHQAGDLLLVEFAKATATTIRAYDVFGRLGGDEFALILPATDQQEAFGAVGRIHDQLGGKSAVVSVSVGVVTYATPTDPLEGLLQAADDLMYQAKQAGGNRLVGSVRSLESASVEEPVDLARLTEPD
ncbi:MAG: GGDEF domain-containing protein [Acidimicrobiia bacterium]|nr:GGDEF domain-containing protein [Acidimicrobiia bacterium]